jgi:peptidoglycan/xylan/chitin deacetylase (PgdA/CDA1 family)
MTTMPTDAPATAADPCRTGHRVEAAPVSVRTVTEVELPPSTPVLLGPGQKPWVVGYRSVAEHTPGLPDVTVTPRRFVKQLRWLAARGLRGRSVGSALLAYSRGDHNVVALTFDDGYADFATSAVPILRQFGYTATVFVFAECLGCVNDWDIEGPRRPLMSVDQVRAVADAGMEIGSHGLRHASLPGEGPAELDRQVRHSRAVLSELLGQPIRGFAYPSGRFGERELHAVREAGYDHACGIGRRLEWSPLALSRTRISDRDNAARMWAHMFQNDWCWR